MVVKDKEHESKKHEEEENQQEEHEEQREEKKEQGSSSLNNLTDEELAILKEDVKVKMQEKNRQQNIQKFLNDENEKLKARKNIVFEKRLRDRVKNNPNIADSVEVLNEMYLIHLQTLQEEAKQKAKKEGKEILDDTTQDKDKDNEEPNELELLGIRSRKDEEGDSANDNKNSSKDKTNPKSLKDFDSDDLDEETRAMLKTI